MPILKSKNHGRKEWQLTQEEFVEMQSKFMLEGATISECYGTIKRDIYWSPYNRAYVLARDNSAMKAKQIKRNPIMTESEYTEMLEYARYDEAEGIEFYVHFLDTMPDTERFKEVRKEIETILYDEKMHLASLAKLIDAIEE